jgi:hypothetical protein
VFVFLVEDIKEYGLKLTKNVINPRRQRFRVVISSLNDKGIMALVN